MENLKNSVSCNSITKSPSISGSCSVQSHLSTTNSKTRLRPIHSYTCTPTVLSPNGLEAKGPSESSSSRLFEVQSITDHLFSFLRLYQSEESYNLRTNPRRKVCWKWFGYIYSFICVVFMTTQLLSKIQDPSSRLPSPSPSSSAQGHLLVQTGLSSTSKFSGRVVLSHLNNLTNTLRMSKLTSICPQPRTFDASVLHATVDAAVATACLWCPEDNLDALVVWASRWQGPISLVVTTSTSKFSTEHEALLGKIQSLRNQTTLRSSLYLHLLHVVPGTNDSPNAYLNLARLFAPTKVVILFPKSLSTPPPFNARASLFTHSPIHPYFPTLISSSTSESFPFPSLSALRLKRDHAFWCTERFFASQSREQNWQECLWQFWLHSFGGMHFIHVTDWDHEDSGGTRLSLNKIHGRLSFNFKAESCDLARKTLVAVEAENQKGSKTKANWLKQFCRSEASKRKEVSLFS